MKVAPVFCKRRGVTLVELVVTLALIALLASLAVPSYRKFVVNQQLSTASGEFLTSLLQARSEALRLGRPTMVVPIQEIRGPTASVYSWLGGWCVFVDATGSGIYSATTSTLINCIEKKDLSSIVSVTTGSGKTSGPFAIDQPFFVYNPSGFAPFSPPGARYPGGGVLNGKLWLKANETGSERAIIVSKSGRARICDPKTDQASTPCSAD